MGIRKSKVFVGFDAHQSCFLGLVLEHLQASYTKWAGGRRGRAQQSLRIPSNSKNVRNTGQ